MKGNHSAPHASMRSLAHRLYCYVLYGKYTVGRLTRLEVREEEPTGSIPLPPIHLRHRVHGSVKPDGFLRVGRLCVSDIASILEAHGLALNSFHRILDFGCGCGRVLRYLRDRAGSAQLYGTDIDPEAIRWCRSHFSGIDFRTNGSLPPTGYPDHHFDLVIAVSVFTHLDEELQNLWLSELSRILGPGGILLATLLNSQLLDEEAKGNSTEEMRNGVVSRSGRTGVFKRDGLPDFYQTTYHRRDYVEKAWGGLFELLDFKERAVNRHQDAVMLRKMV